MKYILFVVLVAQFIFTGCSSAQQKNSNESTEVAQEKDANQIDFENAQFIDVRTPGEFETGSFAEAVNIPLNELESRLDEIDKNNQVVVFCRSGGRASNALQILEKNGFNNVINGINTAKLQSLEK
jgi:rhodanese-related sulfurtransferase